LEESAAETGGVPDEEAALVDRARRGEAPAFVELCARHRARVWRIACSVAREADAEDLAQEVVVRAFRALGTYQGEGSFGAWLCRIAVNAACDYQRSAWRRRVTLFERPREEEPPPGALDGEVQRREVQRRVRQAVAALPETQRVPIWLHYFEEYTLADVARLERTPEATVRSRVRAGLRRLAAALGDLLPAPPRQAFGAERDAPGCGA
jgi:RNA polymerase sigma-70 factor (ECF subfamily)